MRKVIEMEKGQNWLAAAAAVQKDVWMYKDRTLTFLLAVEMLYNFSLFGLTAKNIKPYKFPELTWVVQVGWCDSCSAAAAG